MSYEGFRVDIELDLRQIRTHPVRAAETKRPEIMGPFRVALVFGWAKWTSIKGEMGLSARA